MPNVRAFVKFVSNNIESKQLQDVLHIEVH